MEQEIHILILASLRAATTASHSIFSCPDGNKVTPLTYLERMAVSALRFTSRQDRFSSLAVVITLLRTIFIRTLFVSRTGETMHPTWRKLFWNKICFCFRMPFRYLICYSGPINLYRWSTGNVPVSDEVVRQLLSSLF